MSGRMMSLIGQVRDQVAHWAYIEGSIYSVQYQKHPMHYPLQNCNIRIVVAVTKYYTLECYAGH